MLNELRQHPEYADLLAYVQAAVDKAAESVVIESKRGTIDDIKFVAGRHAALQELYNNLRG